MNKAIEKHLSDFNEACVKLNIPAELPQSPNMPQGMQDFQQAQTMLAVLIAAKREGRNPDYNQNTWKHYPWWYMRDGNEGVMGSGFRLYVVNYGSSNASVGAPFVSESEEAAREIAEKYVELYRIIMNPIQF